MSNLLVSPKWNSFINKVDAGEEITGGDLGNANIATRQLAENVMFLRDSMFTLVADATGDLSQAIVESNKKTKDEFEIVAGLIEAQNEIIIAEAKAREEAISASNTKIAQEAAARIQELGVQSVALQKEIDDRKEAFRLEHISRAESEAAFTESLEEVLSEAEASVKKVENLSSQLIGGYDGSNLDFVTEGLLFQQKTVTSTAIKGMAEQISMLSAGVGEQFDTAEIWHFDKDKEDWINGVFDVGYLTVKSETVTSPTFSIDGDVYHHLKMRINKVGDPDWAGNLVWNTGSIALPEPVFVDDVTLVTLDTTWSGDITQIQLKLSTNADDTNYYKIDWITIGRPSPGASTASVLDLKIATATRDEALAQDIRGLSSKMDTDNALLVSNVNAKLETITTQQQTQATDITTLSSNVDTMNTKLSADIVEVNSTLVTKETALAESIAALTSKTNESEASVLTQLQTLTDVDSALGTQVDALTASFDESAAAITAQNLVFAAEDLAQATQISQLTAKVDGNIAEVNTQIETLTNAESANANKFTSITAEFQALNDKTDASDAEIRVNAADIIEERNTRANEILAQATRIDVLTTEVGDNAASATSRINLLSLEDQALAERLDVLTAATDNTNADINLRLTALADEDSAFSEQLTQVIATVDDNDSAVHERVTALTTATDAEAEKLTLLTAEVGANSAEIESTSRTVATHSGAIAEFNTRLTVEYLPKVENIESNILNAVKQTDVQYYLSISESQPLGGEWLTTAPTWEPSKYMFQRMETTYVDGTIKHTPGINGTNISGAKGDKGLDGKDGSDGVAGIQGPSGADGIRGPAGKDGESSYTHLAYATSKTGTGFSTGYFETATYIGMYVDNIKEDSENYALYNWSLIKGADGTNGIPGPKGTDGKTSYLHIAYANSPDGAEGFSTTASIGKTYIGQYTDFELEDSTNYALYSWTLIKGEKGDQGPIGLTGLEGPKGDKGIQGPMGPMGPRGPEGLRGLTGLEGLQGDQGIRGEKGEDGLSSYTHIAYATSVTGDNFNTGHFDAATYIGMYVDNDKTDSTVPSTYKWSLIKGADGANGIPGPKGTDGKTSYLHIAYANNVTGNIGFSTTVSEGKTHIGQYTDFELVDSSDYTKYNWTLIKGDKGDTGPIGLQGVPGIEGPKGATGIQGPKGADGTSSYTHLAYATSATGTNFNTAWYPTATYIGMYVDRTEEDSIVPSKYNWSLIKGADGANGIAGPKGADGKTTYLHIAYANSEAGDVGFSTTVSAGKSYIGQYTDTTLGDSEDYSIYSWSLIKGADGLSSYAHLAYATSATGTNFNTNHFQGATYIGMYVDNEEDDSTDYTKYNWSLIKGADGANGIPGPTGADGKTSYLHVAYATSATGAVGFSTTVSAGKTYIGQYTDFELADSPSYTKYKWSLIKGDKGDKGDQGIQGPIGLTGLEGPVGATGIQGPKGANGLNSYTHIAYATSADGLDFSTGHFEGATYIGMYVDNTEEDSDVYSKYNWSLIKGADGDKGIAGPAGVDGKTAYLHIAYATSATGNTGFSTTVSAGKTYIGQYTDNELADSPTYTRYKWTLIKGDKGAKGDRGIQGPIGLTGLTGLEGEKGDQGIQGPKGADGLNSYTHLAYATSASGALFSTSWFEAATYIGMYVDNTETDSSTPSAYNWSLIKGADGAQGIPGIKGTDGKTSYLHIAYATSPTGNTGFSTTISDGKTYIGQYTDFEEVDSGSYTKYKWSLIKGEKGDQGPIGLTGLEGPKGDRGIQGPKGDQGPIGLTGLPGLEGAKGDQGIQGPKGSNGLNSYTHLAYATGPLGEGIQTEWYADATYIGMYVDNIATDSTTASKYKWSLIKGADGANGIQGPVGPDGKTAYLHIAYATSANGVDGFSTSVSTGKTYIGQYTDNTLTDSAVPSKYKWTLIKGADGLNSYAHLAYATGPLGQGIQTEWFEAATYIGMYTDNTEADSTVASDYNWSLIKGADGAQGIPGKAGADGLKTYLHIAYATSSNGAIGFSTTVSEGKTYIGQYTDNTLEDSVTYSKYKWSLIKGDKGDKGDQGIQGPIGLTGLTGLEGPKGDQGIQGPKGTNGLNSYTHIAYATSATGNEFSTSWFEAATYIGMYTDNTLTDSTVVTKYKWSLIKGADGNQGIAGPKGTDGKTAYLHIAYATSANGSVGFSTTVSAGKTYIGQYTDNEITDSPTYTKYKWTLIKGEKGDQGPIGLTGVRGLEGPKGDQGIQGPKGDQGIQGPIGLTGLTGLEGAKGDQGIQGPKGADGLNSYTHIAYATGPLGEGIKTAWFAAATYIGMYTDNTSTDSTTASKYKWSLIKGADGANGIAGPTGADGKTAYLHIAYATSANGADGFSTSVSTGKTYIGQYTDNELVDSQVYTKYKWSLIKGADGLNSYTHLAYATGPAGQGIQTSWFEAATYIGMYVDNTETDSTVASKYKWSLIKGADGANGIQGPTGADGKTAYLHIAYATSANGSVGFSTTVSAGKTYIGQYTDNELVDSPSYTKYKWTLIKGDKGDKGDQGPIGLTGVRGLEGAKGAQGIQGPKGVDGLSSYTHLAYATGPLGQGIQTSWFEAATYIGMYVDNIATDSADATKYKWSLIKGADGTNGIQGPTGADGKTAYLHIAYATSATGNTGFSTTVSAGKTYIGQYTDNELVDSQVYTKYKWTLIKGDKGDQGIQGIQGPAGLRGLTGLEGPKGDQGIQGPVGANGLNSYTHLAYATGPLGQGIQTEWFEAATYIGMYVDNTETDSGDATKYKWSLIKGADGNQGIPGPKGADGLKAYLHIAYATSANGSVGFSTSVSAGKAYIGQYTDNELTDSQVYTKYKWTLIKGETGEKGATGNTGATGATGAVGQGIDTITEQYAVSTSKTVAPTTWTTVMPEWSYGLYVWTRSMIKLKNPVATEYTTPLVDSSWEAVNNINVGGRNLLRDSNISVSNNVYAMTSYVLTESPNVGDDIVITIWGTLAADRTSFGAYNSGGSVSIGTLKLVSPGIYRYVGKWVKGAASDTYLQIYQFANGKTSTSTINAIKLEKGNIGTEWSPAPEDTATAIQGSLDIGNSITNEFGILKGESKVLTEIGGKISGWKNLNNGATSSFEILADNFSVSTSTVNIKPFTIVGNDITFNGKVSFNSVTGSISSAQIPAGTISLNQLTAADKTKIDTASSTAATALSNAATAQTKANSAATAAATADGKAVTATNNAATAQNRANQAFTQAGTAETNAKNYADTQVSNIEVGGRNLIVFNSVLAGKYIVETTGAEAVAATHKATDFIPVVAGAAYTLSDLAKNLNQHRIVYYNASKALLSGTLYAGVQPKHLTITTPANCAFVRISGDNTNSPAENWKFEKGNKATDWTPAPEDVDASIASKTKTFTTQPTTPYTSGDIYRNGSSIYVATTSRASGSYVAADWVLVGDVTANNTAADSNKLGGTAASTVVNNAAKGIAVYNDVMSDLKITPVEKTAINQEWGRIQKEYASLVAQATSLGLSTTAYTAAYNGLSTTAPAMSTILASMSTTTTLTAAQRDAYKVQYTTYYTQSADIVKAINEKIAENAKAQADAKSKTFTTTPTTPYTSGDIFRNGSAIYVCTNPRVSGSYTASDWTLVGDVTANNKSADTGKVNGVAAATVVTNAANGAAVYADVMSDLKITPVEKTAINQEWNRIQAEYSQYLAQATTYGIATSTYTAAYTGLSTTAPAMSTILSSMSTTTTLTAAQRDAYKTQYSTYYTRASEIAKLINDAILASANTYVDNNTGNLINNISVSGLIDRWNTGTISNQTFENVSIPVLTLTTTGDSQATTDRFKADPSKAYEVSVWLKSDTAHGSTYIGLNAYNKTGSNIGVNSISNSSGANTTSANTNFYFWNVSGSGVPTGWTKYVAYIMPTGTVSTTMKNIGTNISSNARMLPHTSEISIRILNYYNSGTSTTLWAAHPKVVEVDPNAIIAGTYAQELANSKAKTFVSTPTTPYSLGDLWRDVNTVKVCTTARSSGAYTASDWTLVGDVTANNKSADTGKVNGISAATVASNAANGATVYADVMSDLKITPVEKTAINQEWNRIQKEYASLLAQAQALSVATTTYTAAYTGLSTTAPAMSTILASMSTTTTLTAAQRDAYKTQYTTYYTQAVAIIKAINDKIAANAKAQADAKSTTFTAQPVPPYTAGDLWKDGTTIKVCTVSRASGSYTAADWTLVGDVTSANTAANSLQLGGIAAATVTANAQAGKTLSDNIMSDLIITPVEKSGLLNEWNRIKSEYTNLNSQAVSLGVSAAALTTAYTALNTSTPRIETDILASMVTNYTLTTATRDALKTQLNTYFVQATALSKALTDKVQANAAAAQGTATSANNQVNTWKFTGTTEIDGGKIRTNTITANQIAANTITATQMTTDSITARELKAGTVAATHIVGNTITGDKLVTDAITSREIKAGSITAASGAIADLAVTTGKIANLAVKTAQIDNLAVTTGKIANLAVDTLQIADFAVSVPLASFIPGPKVISTVQASIANFSPPPTLGNHLHRVAVLSKLSFNSLSSNTIVNISAKVGKLSIATMPAGSWIAGTLYLLRKVNNSTAPAEIVMNWPVNGNYGIGNLFGTTNFPWSSPDGGYSYAGLDSVQYNNSKVEYAIVFVMSENAVYSNFSISVTDLQFTIMAMKK